MKKMSLFLVIVFSVTQLWSQSASSSSKKGVTEDRNFRIPLIGESAPSFTANSTNGVINFPGDYGNKWKILFSHPQDFTPVCSSEILELASMQNDFDKLDVKIVVVSADPVDMHEQWVKSLEEIKYKDREPIKIKFPIVEDENIEISKKYGMIHSATNSTKAVRGVFIINPKNIVEAIYFYPMNVGRNTDELVRMISALQITSDHTSMTPANWKVGNDLLVPFPPKTEANNTDAAPTGYYNLAWFMWYKKAN